MLQASHPIYVLTLEHVVEEVHHNRKVGALVIRRQNHRVHIRHFTPIRRRSRSHHSNTVNFSLKVSKCNSAPQNSRGARIPVTVRGHNCMSTVARFWVGIFDFRSCDGSSGVVGGSTSRRSVSDFHLESRRGTSCASGCVWNRYLRLM
jgi:hypothetical protein